MDGSAAEVDAHMLASATVARALAHAAPGDRPGLLIGFLHAAGAGLAVLNGPAQAAEAAYAHADHLATVAH